MHSTSLTQVMSILKYSTLDEVSMPASCASFVAFLQITAVMDDRKA